MPNWKQCSPKGDAMKLKHVLSIFIIMISINCAWSSDPLDGFPIAYVSGCEVDLNKDGINDNAVLLHTSNGYELIVVMRFIDNSKSHILYRSRELTYLSCRYGRQIKETVSGNEEKRGRIYDVNGPYLALVQPEVSTVAFFWSEGK
jgi:hypothetical protein